jgi:hypothetical protein
MAKGSHASGEFLYVLHIFWRSHIEYHHDFGGIEAYAVAADDVVEHNTGRNAKDAFLGVELPFVSIEGFESLIKVVDQGVGDPSFYDDVIDIGLDKVFSYFVVEALLNSTLLCSICIFNPKDMVV